MQILRCFLTNRIVGFNILSMIRKDKKFDIVPIFNQSVKGVWDDFINIEFACNAEIIRSFTGKFRNLCSKEEERQSHLCDYQRNLYNWQHNLAFAAYHKKEMVGFAQGFCFERSSELFSVYSKEAFLEHLYVLPEYQKCGIGSRLLRAFENTSCLIADKISLTPLRRAVDFYVKNGYRYFGDMEKDLAHCSNGVIPVFHWIKKDFNVKFNVAVDSMFLKQNIYQPIFVYLNKDGEIDGVIGGNGENKMWINKKQEKDEVKYCRCQLLKAFSKVK